MNLRIVAFLSVCVLMGGCNEVYVDLAASQCENVVCDGFPRCTDGSTDCPECECCRCPQGERRCDPQRQSGRWACNGSCFAPDPCALNARCEPTKALCVPAEIDCRRAQEEGFDAILRCGDEALCDACGPCITCEFGSGLCNVNIAGGAEALNCSGNSICFDVTTCDPQQQCKEETRDPTGNATAVCTDAVATCGPNECFGRPVCGFETFGCGPCGCCATVAPGREVVCGEAPADGTWSVWTYDPNAGCYVVRSCPRGQACQELPGSGAECVSI